jgi:hypothetical protein
MAVWKMSYCIEKSQSFIKGACTPPAVHHSGIFENDLLDALMASNREYAGGALNNKWGRQLDTRQTLVFKSSAFCLKPGGNSFEDRLLEQDAAAE